MKASDVKAKRIWINNTQYKITKQMYEEGVIWEEKTAFSPDYHEIKFIAKVVNDLYAITLMDAEIPTGNYDVVVQTGVVGQVAITIFGKKTSVRNSMSTTSGEYETPTIRVDTINRPNNLIEIERTSYILPDWTGNIPITIRFTKV